MAAPVFIVGRGRLIGHSHISMKRGGSTSGAVQGEQIPWRELSSGKSSGDVGDASAHLWHGYMGHFLGPKHGIGIGISSPWSAQLQETRASQDSECQLWC